MIISSSYHTHTIARLQHLLRALGREGEESKRVTDGTPREQIDEGETRRVLGGGDEGRLLRARVTGVEVRLTVLRRQTNTLNLRALVRQEDVSPERQRQRVGALMVILTSPNRAETRAPRFAVRVCFATRL